MSLSKTTLDVTVGKKTFSLKRPGIGGLRRIPRRILNDIGDQYGQVIPELEARYGAGAKMEAVLQEYLVEAPGWARHKKPDPGMPESRPHDFDFEEVDLNEFLVVGEAAVEFHEGFREFLDRLRGSGGDGAGSSGGVA